MSSDNFITIEKSFYNDLIRNKGKMEAIIDCLLTNSIPEYSTETSAEWINAFLDSKIGIKKDTLKSDMVIIESPKSKEKREEK